MNLEFKQPDELYLPIDIGSADLTIAEIGAIVLFSCLQKGNQSEEMAVKMSSPEFSAASLSLKEKGVLSVAVEDGTLKMVFDLDAAMPEETEESEE